MATKRNYPCPECSGTGELAAWDKGCEFSQDPAHHYEVICPDCTFGVVECEFSDLDVADLCLCPEFIAECALAGAECVTAAAAIQSGDLASLGAVFLDAIVRESYQRVDEKTESNGGISRSRAIKLLVESFQPSVGLAA